jgi:hypothetical protein
MASARRDGKAADRETPVAQIYQAYTWRRLPFSTTAGSPNFKLTLSGHCRGAEARLGPGRKSGLTILLAHFGDATLGLEFPNVELRRFA